MINLSRRKLIVSGLAATAGASGLAVAARLAQKYGLVPPDHGGIYGLGETLTYASQRLLTRHSLAREFPRSKISTAPIPERTRAPHAKTLSAFRPEASRTGGSPSTAWSLNLRSFSIADLKSYPSRSHITELACEEGWSYIAEWIGVPLSHVLNLVGVHPQARYVVYCSMEPDYVGQHRYGRCSASADISLLRHEWRRPSGGPRRTASHAAPSANRLQEHKIHHSPDGHRQSERLRQGLRRCGMPSMAMPGTPASDSPGPSRFEKT